MLEKIYALPLHAQWDFILLVFCTLLVYVTCGMGYLSNRLCRSAQPTLPPFGFPNALDRWYTFFFIGCFVVLCSGNNVFAAVSEPLDPENACTLVAMATTFGMYLPMVLRYVFLPRQEDKPALKLGRFCLVVFLSLLCIYAVNIAVELSGLMKWIQTRTGAPDFQDVVTLMREGSTEVRIRVLVSAVILAPIGEEICFRGFLYRTLRHYAGPFAATLVTGMFFACIHTALLQFIPLMVVGCVLCIVYEYTKRIWVCMAIHALFNLLACIATLILVHYSC